MTIPEKQELREEETPSQQENVKERKNFAAMNGVKDLNINIESSDEVEKEIPEPEEIVTTRTVSQNPFLKVIVIGGGILMFVMLIGGVINGSMNALKASTNQKIEPKQNSQEVEEPVVDETGKDKTALALTSQSVDLKKVRDLKAVPETTPTPKHTPYPVSATPTTPVPIRRPVVQNPPYRPEILPSVRHNQPPIVQHQPKPTQYQAQRNTITATKTPAIDPMQQWLAVANAGSFSTNTAQLTPELSDSTQADSTEEIKGGLGKPKLDKQTPKNQSENTNYSQARVLVGTRAEGKLETPIVWNNHTENQALNYLIRLTKPLKASTGSEILPKDSYIVVQMKGANQSEYIQLQAVAALVNTNGETEEKSIPEGTVLILAKNGKLLKAESRRGGDLGGTLFSAVLSGVTKAAEIQNRPNSQVITNNNGFSSSTISNENKDLLAGFTEGTLSEIVRGIQTNNQQRIQQFQSADKVFVIEAGKEVQIFVNQTINL